MEIELESNQDQIRKNLADSIRESFEDNLFGDVMVVGGGVSGVQASLDLAASGFKVYLVDKAPAIGGHMAQLDKTFPTNDCSI
jgi:heterodisulfide reductase subunit A